MPTGHATMERLTHGQVAYSSFLTWTKRALAATTGRFHRMKHGSIWSDPNVDRPKT